MIFYAATQIPIATSILLCTKILYIVFLVFIFYPMFLAVQTPQQAIQLMEYVHNQLTSKRAKSIHDALKSTGKCRKTIDRFRYIYYLSVLDKDKLDEVVSGTPFYILC